MSKNKHFYTFIFLLFALISSTKANVELTSVFNESNKAYNNEEFSKADSLYSIIDAKGFYSSELFYNWGNVNYKLGNIPETIYYYEKALKLSPGNEEIIHNLKLANKRIADKNTIKTSSRIEDVIYSYIKSSTNLWANISIVLMLMSGLLLILFILSKKNKIKKMAFYIATSLLLMGMVTIYISSLQNKKLSIKEYGIVFTPSVELKMEPSDNSNPAFVLHEGTKVKLLNENENWYEISFDKGQIAWIKKEELKVY